jgi:hypothetical protein
MSQQKPKDDINHPKHYNSHPSGIESIVIEEHMNFCLGNVHKYIMRCDYKGKPIEDLKKARWYLNREIERREKELIFSNKNLDKKQREIYNNV